VNASLPVRLTLRLVVLAWLGLLLVAPVSMVFVNAFDQGFDTFWAAVSHPAATHALGLTIIATVCAVFANTVFGVFCALLIVRRRPRGAAIINAMVDIPFAISPVVVGLALLLTFGVQGWFGEWFVEIGLPIIFSLPGIVLATIFVTLPFVVREVIPVLHEIGDEQEQAASTLGAGSWQTFWRITLPSIRWGLSYGVVLTAARALGEYGAVAVVSGRIAQRTQTTTVFIEERYQGFDPVAVYGASLVLAAVALVFLVLMTMLASHRGDGSNGH
jgi:sulfate/thiosulfate transport system permease protein